MNSANAQQGQSIHPDNSEEDRAARRAIVVFPFIILAAFFLGFLAPGAVTFIVPYISVALGLIMFGMGLTLTVPDFALVVKRPLPVLLGVFAQFVIMPAVAIALVKVLGLHPALAVGVILVGCAPGGTSSNVISYLAKGDVALSVSMTSISTLLAPIFTPVLTLWLAGEYLPVSGGAMAMSVVKMVLVPVVGGIVVRMLLRGAIDRVLPILPWLSVAGIAVVVAAVVSTSADKLVEAGLLVLLVVVLHNALGFVLGYVGARLFGVGERAARTTSIEVGMQNSGLAATLAATYFEPMAALPGAVFSVWHNISGGLLAMYYRRFGHNDAAERRSRASGANASSEAGV
ncbi:bile acid:sodium symporter family protein [Corynebacterium lactis]|uniref:Na+-dependent transporter n=1 Tax=Corynebacterium lactis RW2-5 TaxID=1408189 RepID=A0A0K2GYZ1_9CORY|nr:bile acid:sodium symporter family protein [Corynebacterium lactis]ALA67004.1 Na+-dependent transporter [Corynebacterium lactis RW2-5]